MRVLIGYDGSDSARAALAAALPVLVIPEPEVTP
jgi:hypothetical protein